MTALERKIRVLIVDDSVVMRRLLSEALASDGGLEIAGYAANGRIALALLDQVAPDIVTLDVEMPVMDGLATLKALRERRRTLPVIMFSTLTERGAEATIDALALGASDYVAKPVAGGDYNTARDRIRDALLPKIKALCRKQYGVTPAAPAPLACMPVVHRHKQGSEPVSVVAIGCSTGGPNALAQVLPAIPHDFPAAILVVQHMPPAFTRFLAQRLTSLCQLPVEEAEEGSSLTLGRIRWPRAAITWSSMAANRRRKCTSRKRRRKIPAGLPWMFCFVRSRRRFPAGRWQSCSPAWGRTACEDVRPWPTPVGKLLCRTKRPPWSGACRALWLVKVLPTPYSLSLMSASTLCGG
jgi:CheY-like chemotaxis protein